MREAEVNVRRNRIRAIRNVPARNIVARLVSQPATASPQLQARITTSTCAKKAHVQLDSTSILGDPVR